MINYIKSQQAAGYESRDFRKRLRRGELTFEEALNWEKHCGNGVERPETFRAAAPYDVKGEAK